MCARAALLVVAAAAGAMCARAEGDNSTRGVAGVVPHGYTEVCAVRGDVPQEAAEPNGNSPSPFVVLTYAGRTHKSPTQDNTFSPVWQGSGCSTFPTAAAIEGATVELNVELWDDRTRVFDPLSVVYKDVLLGSGTTQAGESSDRWITLNDGTVAGARIFVVVTVAPPFDDGSIERSPEQFKSLTSTPAFFVYVGAATFTIIVCVCCMWGKGTPPPARAIPPLPTRKSGESKLSMSEEPLREPSQPVVLQSVQSRPTLTIEVATPPAGREMQVIPVTDKPGEQPARKSPAQPAPRPAASRWPTFQGLFGAA
ncbi:hypothetical protein KFE25_009159 [Diacronema lutheri]|uniref:C2 domain-containing protein n=2 Tax=Diacronema lutheri TaxID=2081491 RepID=A0A8J6CK66_DIALT|nr:hypothetical protein KFE25_009159 [Diacronema lutheri]